MTGDNTYRAIVMGASAGGLHALSYLLENLPLGYPLPIVIVQHRSKYPRDLFEEVLQSKCKIKIKQADEKERIIAGIVYIAPPDYHLLIEEDHSFSLSADDLVQYSRPSIDVLFESAAQIYKDELLGIILTGANSDGAAGITAISNNNGLTIAQDPAEAEFPVMPDAAIKTGKVQCILSLAEILGLLTNSILIKNERND